MRPKNLNIKGIVRPARLSVQEELNNFIIAKAEMLWAIAAQETTYPCGKSPYTVQAAIVLIHYIFSLGCQNVLQAF
jgi:hypothetical protein